ncbi:phage tail protein, partial [Escherichia coli]
MDRQIVYNGQLPLETDVLHTNLYAMIAIGRLCADILGTSTVVSGLACTPTSPASMAVNIGAGAIYSLQN